MDIRFWTSGKASPAFHLLNEAFLQVADDAVNDAPLDEVQLGDSRRQALEFDASRTTERIEELLGVPV